MPGACKVGLHVLVCTQLQVQCSLCSGLTVAQKSHISKPWCLWMGGGYGGVRLVTWKKCMCGSITSKVSHKTSYFSAIEVEGFYHGFLYNPLYLFLGAKKGLSDVLNCDLLNILFICLFVLISDFFAIWGHFDPVHIRLYT